MRKRNGKAKAEVRLPCIKLTLGRREHLAFQRVQGYNSPVTLEVLGMNGDIYNKARDIGRLVAQSKALLPTLALAALEAAERGDIGEEDAGDIYAVYSEATEPDEPPTVNSLKANTSKMRQIIRAGSDRRGAKKAFDRLTVLHAELYKRDSDVLPLYKSMVNLARWMRDRDDSNPSDRTLVRLMKG